LLDDNIIYVDLLNEYPDCNGYDWLKMELNKRTDARWQQTLSFLIVTEVLLFAIIKVISVM